MERKYIIKGASSEQLKNGFAMILNCYPDVNLIENRKMLVVLANGLSKNEIFNLIDSTFKSLKKSIKIVEIDEFIHDKFILEIGININFNSNDFLEEVNKIDGIDEVKLDGRKLFVSYTSGIDIKKCITKYLPKGVRIKDDTFIKTQNFFLSKINKDIIDVIKKIPDVTAIDVDGYQVKISYYDRMDFVSYFKNFMKEYDESIRVENYVTLEDDEEHLGLIKLIIGFSLLVVGGMNVGSFLGLCLLIASIVILGIDVLLRAIINFYHGKIFDADFLISIAIIGSLFRSYLLESALVLFIYQISILISKMASSYREKNIKNALKRIPTKASILVNNRPELVFVEQVFISDIIIVKPGEIIPLDGEIINGSTSVDQSIFTGENKPRYLNSGDFVKAGYKNLSGVIKIRVTKLYNETKLYKLFNNIKEATSEKTNIERFSSIFNYFYSAISLLIALILILIPFLSGGDYIPWLDRSLIFLIVANPLAVNLSIPITYLSSMIFARNNDLYLKGSDTIERLGEVESVVLNYNSLLSNELELINVKSELDSELLWQISSSMVIRDDNPYFKAILEANSFPMNMSIVSDIKVIKDLGVIGKYNDSEIYLGNKDLLNSFGIFCEEDGYFLYCEHILASFSFRPKLKSSVKGLATDIYKLGVNRVCLFVDTEGDSQLLHSLGFNEIYLDIKQDDKLQILKSLKDLHLNPLVLGDMNNSLEMLANAYLAATINDYNDDLSDIYIVDDDPAKIATSIKIGRTVKRINRNNLFFQIIVKMLFIILTLLGKTTIVYAILVDLVVSLISVFYSLFKINRLSRKE